MFYKVFYNALVWLVGIMPEASLGLAVIALTVVVKLLLAPLSYKSLRTQILQKRLQPQVDELRKKYTDPQEQSKKMMELYKEAGTNPFSGCLVIAIQIPIILGLYTAFLRGIDLNPEALYAFVQYPADIVTRFIATDLTMKSIPFAIAAAAAQFMQMQLSEAFKTAPKITTDVADTNPMANFGATMQKQMKVMMPIMIGVFATFVPAAVALYWITSALFMTAQEKLMRRSLREI